MTDRTDSVMSEVWAWKRRTEEVTRDLSGPELIAFYRTEAERMCQRYGLHLSGCSAAEAARRHRVSATSVGNPSGI